MSEMPCPFCAPTPDRIIAQSEHAIALWDGFPVAPGHALVVPRRHVETWFDARDDEHRAIFSLIDSVREVVQSRHSPSGWNIGMNLGRSAGQTVPHLHVHVIPRHDGDVPDPRGGIRWVLPGRADYWSRH